MGQTLHNCIFIPARYPSSRFPGKPLAMLTGATGETRSLIHRSWDAACAVSGVDAVYILTDDDRIADAARAFGADVLMTTERPGTAPNAAPKVSTCWKPLPISS